MPVSIVFIGEERCGRSACRQVVVGEVVRRLACERMAGSSPAAPQVALLGLEQRPEKTSGRFDSCLCTTGRKAGRNQSKSGWTGRCPGAGDVLRRDRFPKEMRVPSRPCHRISGLACHERVVVMGRVKVVRYCRQSLAAHPDPHGTRR